MEAHPEGVGGEGAGEEGKSEERGSSGSGGVCIHPRELDGSLQGERVRHGGTVRCGRYIEEQLQEEVDTFAKTPSFSIFYISFRSTSF